MSLTNYFTYVEKSAKLNHEDNTPERLLVKEQVAKAKLQKLKRNLT